MEVEAGHHRGAGHRVAVVDLIFLRQEVVSPHPDVQPLGDTVLTAQIPQHIAFLLGVVAHSRVQVGNVLLTQSGTVRYRVLLNSERMCNFVANLRYKMCNI